MTDNKQTSLQDLLNSTPLGDRLSQMLAMRQQRAARNLELRAAFLRQDADYFQRTRAELEAKYLPEAPTEEDVPEQQKDDARD